MKLKYNSYNEMPLKVFNSIVKIDVDNEVDFEITLLSILCDCDEDDILNLSLTDYSKIRNQAQFIANYPKPQAKTPDYITINDTKYKVCKNLKDVTAAQYIDYQSYLKMDEKKYEYMLSCFLIPEGKQYGDGYDIQDVVNDILDLNVVSVMDICFFFLNLFLTSTKALVHYWESKLKKMMKKEKNLEMKNKIQDTLNQIHLLKNGIG